MKCQAAYIWLLTAKETATLPDEVQRHLGHCRRCQRCQRRLLHLDAEMKRPPAALEDPGLQARLFPRLTVLPRQTSSPPPAPRVPRSRRVLVWMAAATVLLGFGLGWLVGRQGNPPGKGPSSASSSLGPSLQKVPSGDMVVRAVNHDRSLAETWMPAVQVRTLAALAADLRQEALRLGRQGPLEDLPLVATLYQKVLRRGIIGRACVLPAEKRPTVLTPLAQQLQESADNLSRVAEETLPALAEHFQAMANVAGDTSHALLNPPPAPPPEKGPNAFDGSRSLLEILVLEGLRLAEEDDPLRRADVCSAIAEQLVQKILLTAALQDTQQASALGQSLGELVDHGVTGNLNRVPEDEDAPERRPERARIRRRVAAAEAVLQSNLQRAPAPARGGLQRALEASRKRLEQAAQAGQGKGKKGKPKGKPAPSSKGKSTFPPGLEKKRDKDNKGQRKGKGQRYEE